MGAPLGVRGGRSGGGGLMGEDKKPMRVLALVTDAFGGLGGIAQYNRDFLTALAKSDSVEKIIVLIRAGHAKPADLPEKLTQLAPQGNKLAYAAKAMRVAAAHGPFDMIFCGHLYMAPLAALLSAALRIPYWLQIHGIEAWQRRSRLEKWAAERASQVMAVSRHTRRRFLVWADIEPWRVKVLPNTVNGRFQPGPKPAHLIERYGLEGKTVLLTVSRLAAAEGYKGHDRVIEALPQILIIHPETVYLIVGDGDDRPRLEALAKELGVANKVCFAGAVRPEDLPDYYRAADIFIMPSTGEGFGIAFLEAAACGLPVIGGDRDGSLDALREGALGQTIDPMNANAIASAVSSALSRGMAEPPDTSAFSFQKFAAHVEALASGAAWREAGVSHG